jgi:hypothetical protein
MKRSFEILLLELTQVANAWASNRRCILCRALIINDLNSHRSDEMMSHCENAFDTLRLSILAVIFSKTNLCLLISNMFACHVANDTFLVLNFHRAWTFSIAL